MADNIVCNTSVCIKNRGSKFIITEVPRLIRDFQIKKKTNEIEKHSRVRLMYNGTLKPSECRRAGCCNIRGLKREIIMLSDYTT